MIANVDKSHARQNMTVSSELYGKRAVFLGDSLCAGTTVGKYTPEYGYGWGGLIGEKNGMDWENFGRNGAVITEIEGQERIVSRQLEKALQKYSTLDYILFEGGCNDADQLGDDPALIGEIADGFSEFDNRTFSGAFEQLIHDMIHAYPDAKIGYVIPPKMGEPPYDSDSNLRRQYYDRAMEICEKWGIPCLDLWNANPMNPELTIYYDEAVEKESAEKEGKFYTDSQHLTLRGYQRIASQVEAFLCSL